MTQPTRIYKHSSVGTDWAALLLGAGLGLTLALQLTTVRKSDFTSLYASLAERGAHINDPYTGLIAIGAQSATVVGPLGWLCDGLATALMVAGTDGAKYFAQPELAGYKPFVINRHENTSWSI